MAQKIQKPHLVIEQHILNILKKASLEKNSPEKGKPMSIIVEQCLDESKTFQNLKKLFGGK